MKKNILGLNNIDAKSFFLSQEAYSNISLPEYFSFEKLLLKIDDRVDGKDLDCSQIKKAKKCENINYILYGNKDGKYAWRKFQFIHPLLYISLVNLITKKENWRFLQKCFIGFQKNNFIECGSIPALKERGRRQVAQQISQWSDKIERRSVALSLEYSFLYQTDITDCYGSIYSHSLPWAIHGKEISKDKRGCEELFGNKIDNHLQAMSYGQTNGIPQGSILMDFVAEIVLGYADSELSKRLTSEMSGRKFHILRYRDDYRIFVNNITDGDIVLKCLSEVLIDLNFKLNTSKTFFDTDVISGSIKEDKLKALTLAPVPQKLSEKKKVIIFKNILTIQQISKTFPNSGTVDTRLSELNTLIEKKGFGKEYDFIEVIVGLLTDIVHKSPKSIPIIARLISKSIEKLPSKKQEILIKKFQDKICTLSNIGLLEIWVQRIIIKLNLNIEFKEKLCSIVCGEKYNIFNTNWIDIQDMKEIINNHEYVDMKKIKEMKRVIESKEVQIFNYITTK